MKKKTEPSLTELADAAFLQTSRKVIERAKQTGTPVIVWEDGEIKALDPHTIQLPPERKAKKKQ